MCNIKNLGKATDIMLLLVKSPVILEISIIVYYTYTEILAVISTVIMD